MNKPEFFFFVFWFLFFVKSDLVKYNLNTINLPLLSYKAANFDKFTSHATKTTLKIQNHP